MDRISKAEKLRLPKTQTVKNLGLVALLCIGSQVTHDFVTDQKGESNMNPLTWVASPIEQAMDSALNTQKDIAEKIIESTVSNVSKADMSIELGMGSNEDVSHQGQS